ncbi:RagB/SusD family nutrient uptake outer membrane protein [Carboxylicivirga caseinilyticus]|uniref:RagB/SusD family nutrient uptake outer membrane protein n=1 Tax=Carboxylicivirga caseinilyticus TaxID=3417572 RepID=UPI003D33BCF4|nr:RagB/SusD family nutrient uptake outer membrane protein [Marinilabiliaceae bacterium A049]
MKKISLFQLFILSVFALTFSGCQDFLEKEVLGHATDENFYNTKFKLQAALDATYNVLQTDQFNSCDWRFGEACGDDVWGGDESLTSQQGQLSHFLFNTSNDWILSRYEINYEGVNKANQVIANAHRVQLSNDDYSEYKEVRQILGQAKFLRALFYFNLVKTYGGVPIRPEKESIDSLIVPRSTAEEVYAYIEKDLREAAIMLPARFTESNAGKASAASAVALLMKTLLYQTTPGEPSDEWDEIVKLGGYFVDGDDMTYGSILNYDGGEDWETLRKRLWFKPEEVNGATDPYETTATLLPQLNNAYTLEYVDYMGASITYDEMFYQTGEFNGGSVFEIVFKESADGSGGDVNEGSGVYGSMWYSPPVVFTNASLIDDIFGNDPRRTLCLTHNDYAPDGGVCFCGPGKYVTLKWYTPVKERPQYGGDNGKNRRLIRFQEVVLTYAEALNETGNREAALIHLNRVKTEANTINGTSTLYIAGGYGYMRDQIWSERRKELCFEWDRFFDLVRQRRAAEVIKEYGANRANKRGYYFRKGVNELFPIPQKEIDISNGVITQNPGY